MGRTVPPLLADCPPGRRGPSVRLVGKRCSTGRSRSNNGPSAPGRRTVRVPRELSTGVSRTVRACRTPVGPRPRDENQAGPFSSLSRPKTHTSLFLALSLSKKKLPTLKLLIQALPGPSEHNPGLSARFSTMSSGYFFRIPHSISQILSKKVIMVWRCDLNFVHSFKFLSW
jgi:hypothetical protein